MVFADIVVVRRMRAQTGLMEVGLGMILWKLLSDLPRFASMMAGKNVKHDRCLLLRRHRALPPG